MLDHGSWIMDHDKIQQKVENIQQTIDRRQWKSRKGEKENWTKVKMYFLNVEKQKDREEEKWESRKKKSRKVEK